MSDGYPEQCNHGSLVEGEQTKLWLTKGSRAHQALAAVVQ